MIICLNMIDLTGYKLEVYSTTYINKVTGEPLELYNLLIYRGDITTTLFLYALVNKIYIMVDYEMLLGEPKDQYIHIKPTDFLNRLNIEDEERVLVDLSGRLVKGHLRDCFNILLDNYLIEYERR